MSREGHDLALALAVFAVLNAIIAGAYASSGATHRDPAAGHVAAGLALVLLAAAALGATFSYFGGRSTLTRNAVDSFQERPPAVEGDLTRRLFSFGADVPSCGRRRGAAAREVVGTVRAHTSCRQRHRQVPAQARDAHNIYLETLSALGIVGAVLLGTALLIPFAAAWRARAAGLTVGAVGAYTAYVVHASVDWDWEMPVVTVAALFCAGALLAAARGAEAARARRSARARRA